MYNQKFLEQIADYYTDAARIDTLGDTIFIFPNKRSALFLKYFIQRRLTGEYTLMPEFTTFSHFAARTTRTPEASRFELLFLLYDTYSRILEKHRSDIVGQIPDFDKFIFWGDMILDDFDEIDRSLADPVKIYKNLKDVHELTSDYLTQEQKDIIKRIWGETNLTTHIEGFWRHIDYKTDEDNSKSDITKKFISLWEILSPIYELFSQRLNEERMITPGKQMLRAMEIIRDTPIERLQRKRYIFVGLADVSNAEISIMKRLRDAGTAEFFWDIASPVLSNNHRNESSSLAITLIEKLCRLFPMPDDFELEKVNEPGHINIIGVPSSVQQTKIAGDVIERLKHNGIMDAVTAFNTAVVLPDPSQLTPLLLSLPDGLPGVNITMGLPYSTTTFATLFSSIISMQRRGRRNREGRHTFFFQDILEILLHPHIQLIAGEKAGLMRQFIYDRHLFNIEADRLTGRFGELAFIFQPVNNIDDIEDSYKYVENLINGLRDSLSGHKEYDASFEKEILNYLDEQISALKLLVQKYSVVMRETTFLSLFERILEARNINVEGTPLSGLQIMGVLETRALDFENLIILAMNERSFPRREYIRTMIPNNLRRGYGLPSIEQTESFYTYYFFRAISRAKNITLLYDSRPPGKGRGEMSRYLQQLLHIYDSGNISHSIVELNGIMPTKRDIVIRKTPEIMKQLENFKIPGGLKISASALKTYLRCPLAFYLQYVNGLRDDDEPVDFMDAAKLGDIFHHTIKRIYDRYIGKTVSADTIRNIISDPSIERIIIEEIAAMQGLDPAKATEQDLNYEGLLILSQVKIQIQIMLEAEIASYCSDGHSFIYLEGEKDVAPPEYPQWTIGGHTFNFRMQIDRIDRIDNSTIRFIDYKTGSDGLTVGSSMQNLFCGDHSKNAIFQLLTYAAAYKALVDDSDDIVFSLHIIKDIAKKGKIDILTYNKKPLGSYSQLQEEFLPLLEQTISNIFDDNTDFNQCEKIEDCKFCPFVNICGRTLPADDF